MRARLLPLLAASVALSVLLTGCIAFEKGPPLSSSTFSQADRPSADARPGDGDSMTLPSMAPSPTSTPSPTPIRPTPGPTDPKWNPLQFTSTAQCDAVRGNLMYTVGSTQITTTPRSAFEEHLSSVGLWENSPSECTWSLGSSAAYIGLHIGQTPTGVPFNATANFASFPGSNGPAAYQSEKWVMGVLYSAWTECAPGFSCEVCHFVEGYTVVSIVRPSDGNCRNSLKPILDQLRKEWYE